MNIKERNNSQVTTRGLSLGLLAALFAAAGILASVFPLLFEGGPKHIVFIAGSNLAIIVVQLTVLKWSFKAFIRRAKQTQSDSNASIESVKEFPAAAALRIYGATALAGAVALISFSSAVGLKPDSLIEPAAWIIIVQGAFGFPVFTALKRVALNLQASSNKVPAGFEEPNIYGPIFIMGALSAGLSALCFNVLSANVVEKNIGKWAVFEEFSYIPSSLEKNILGFLILALALLISTFVSFRLGTELSRNKGYVEMRAFRFPMLSKHSSVNFSKELAILDVALDELSDHLTALKETESDVITKGQDTREIKDEFFAGMSHDLRSPLNSIIGFTDLLLKGMEGPLAEEHKKLIELISSDAQGLMILISDILDTSKMKAQKFEIDRKWVPSVEVFTNFAAEVERTIQTKQIELHSSFTPGLPPVYVDKSRLCKVLLSLAFQIVKMMDKGIITITADIQRQASSEKQFLRVDLMDSLRKVSRADRKRIKQAFKTPEGLFQINKTGGSLGLSIALAREVLLLHGGELRSSETGNDETIFGILLPLEENP